MTEEHNYQHEQIALGQNCPGLDKTAAASSAAASAIERETSKPFGKCRPEFVPMLQTLLSTYDEKRKRNKEAHNRQLKQIHSYIQGYDGIVCECYKCERVLEVIDAEVHHVNNNPADNRISNTGAIHGRCNRELNGAKGGEVNKQRAAARGSLYQNVAAVGVRESRAPTHTDVGDYGGMEWTSKEGKKHDRMRAKWDNLLWTLFDPEREEFNWIERGRLAKFARSPDFVGEGASTTFYKMIDEDVTCRVLEEGQRAGDLTEIVRMVWPEDKDRRAIEDLATTHKSGKIAETDVIDAIRTLVAQYKGFTGQPKKEIRPHLNYFRWVMNRLNEGRTIKRAEQVEESQPA